MARTFYPAWYGVTAHEDTVKLSVGDVGVGMDLILTAPQALMIAHLLMQAIVTVPNGNGIDEPHVVGVAVRDETLERGVDDDR